MLFSELFGLIYTQKKWIWFIQWFSCGLVVCVQWARNALFWFFAERWRHLSANTSPLLFYPPPVLSAPPRPCSSCAPPPPLLNFRVYLDSRRTTSLLLVAMSPKIKHACHVVGCVDPHKSVFELPSSEEIRSQWLDFGAGVVFCLTINYNINITIVCCCFAYNKIGCIICLHLIMR